MRRFISTYWQRGIEALEKVWTFVGREQGETERKEREAKNEANWQKVRDSIESISDEIRETAKQNQTNEDRKLHWERRRFWLDVGAVVVAACAALFLLGQQKGMKAQLDEMQYEQRAWIDVDATLSREPYIVPNVGAAFELRVVRKNVGKSPAFDVTVSDLPTDASKPPKCIRETFESFPTVSTMFPGNIQEDNRGTNLGKEQLAIAQPIPAQNKIPFHTFIGVCVNYRIAGDKSVHQTSTVYELYKLPEDTRFRFNLQWKHGD